MPRITKVIIVVVLTVFLAVIIVTIVVMNRAKLKTVALAEVTNFDEASDLPVGYKNEIERMIGGIVNDNNETTGLVFSEAVIREGTYKETVGDSSVDAEFILDVPELKYSFQVEVTWARKTDKNEEQVEDPNILIQCPHYLDVIYTDKKCIAQSPEQQLKRYLPYYEDLESGQRFGVDMKKSSGEPYVAVEVKSCGNTAVADNALSATKKWIKSIYLDPNDYSFQLFDICKR